MLVRFLVTAAIALAFFSACQRSTESKLIGTWNVPVIDASTRITYKADHTCDVWSDGLGGASTETAEWRLEGDRIITRYKGREAATIIVSISQKDLRVKDANKDTIFTYTRVK